MRFSRSFCPVSWSGSADSEFLPYGHGVIHLERGSFAHFSSKVLREPRHVVGEDCCLVAGAGYGDVAEAGVQEVGMNACIGVNKNALGGYTLGAVAGDCVAVVEVPILSAIEFNLPAVVEPGAHSAVRRDGLDYGHIPVGDSETLVR